MENDIINREINGCFDNNLDQHHRYIKEDISELDSMCGINVNKSPYYNTDINDYKFGEEEGEDEEPAGVAARRGPVRARVRGRPADHGARGHRGGGRAPAQAPPGDARLPGGQAAARRPGRGARGRLPPRDGRDAQVRLTHSLAHFLTRSLAHSLAQSLARSCAVSTTRTW